MISKKEARRLLPKVGDVREEIPSYAKAPGMPTPPPQKCVVVEVNTAHLWYRVAFIETGLHECYKVPRSKLGPFGGLRR